MLPWFITYVGAVVQDIPENTNKCFKTELLGSSRSPLTSAILFQVELSRQIYILCTAAICHIRLPTPAHNIKEHFKSQVQPSTRSLGLLQKLDWLNQVLRLKNSYCSQRGYLPTDQWGQILLIIHIPPGSAVKLLVWNPPAPTFSTVFKAAQLQGLSPSPLGHYLSLRSSQTAVKLVQTAWVPSMMFRWLSHAQRL